MMDGAAPRKVARKAESNDLMRALARAGFIANGVVHGLVGILVLVVAFGGDGDADQAGAFRAVAAAPAGFVALWLIAIALWALAIWQVFDGILARDPDDGAVGAAKKWGRRIGRWGQAVLYVVLGGIAAAAALGARPDAEQTTESASRDVLAVPGGGLVLAAVGIAIGVGGIVFVYRGAGRGFRDLVDPPPALGAVVTVVGVVGYVAKGVALLIIGAMLVISAVMIDPDAAASLDGAIKALLTLPLGRWLAGVIGLGFIAYGVFCCFRAAFARL